MSGWGSLTSVLVAGLLGSLHCVGMCGGLVSFYAGGSAAPRGPRWAAHGAYHLTRLCAYALLGASAGHLGAALDLAGRRLGLAALGAASAAAILLIWGARLVLGRPGRERLVSLGRSPLHLAAGRRLEALFAGLAQRARQRSPLWRASVLGLSSALLPCGWLYAFVVLAAGTGSGSRGAWLLAAFWSGTVPALLGLGLGIERLSQPLRARLPRFSAALLLVAGLFNVASRWPARAGNEAAASAAPATPDCHATR